MSRLNPFAKLPGLNAASVLLVENEEHFQQSLAEALVKETSVTVNVFQSAEASLKYLEPGYFLGKVCFMVSNARSSSVPAERLDAVRRLAASLHCPLLFAEDQTQQGVTNAAERLLTILKVAAGFVPFTTSLCLSNLTRSTLPPDIDQPSFD
ncbi:centromere protein M isoform X2 [Oryzias melastigma]|uniref:centromere protein M isoform X2 n=1 Tax=Oryzias melastigma TaxID=30732 RepID=UPI000CF83900|nr:centromere protein M isoform X2 [Oryzias melastigma]